MVSWLLRAIAVVGVVSAVWLGSAADPASAAGLSDPSKLEVHQGNLTVRNDGQVVENLEIRGTLRIEANNVVVRNVWVYTSSFWTIYVGSGSATFDDVEIGHPNYVGERGIGGANIVARNLDIHDVEDGIKIGTNVVYDRVHIHDLNSRSGSPHIDAVQADGGQSNAVIKNSILDARGPRGLGNAAAMIKPDLGPLNNIRFENNYLNGGNYVVFSRQGQYGTPSNVTFKNNRIGSNFKFGVLSYDGSITWQNNVWDATGKSVGTGSSSPSVPAGTFRDTSNSVFFNDIEWLVDQGLTKGCNSAGDKFCPDASLTRGQMAAFLVRALGLKSSLNDPFVDDGDSIFEADIEKIAAAGITTGCNPPRNDRFCPDKVVTRGQMAAFLVRALSLKTTGIPNAFSDDNGSVFQAEVNALAHYGIARGCNPPSNTSFCPNKAVTRAQLAAFLHRALD
ncbi:MAG: right-handed parallel beta-helix repeat-containing protein [Acidimicrobiia bacterium]